jgi:hypothetical protein
MGLRRKGGRENNERRLQVGEVDTPWDITTVEEKIGNGEDGQFDHGHTW